MLFRSWGPLLGLEWTTPDGTSRMTVTTLPLFREWRSRVAKEADQDWLATAEMRDVLRSDLLWNVGRCNDAAFIRYCDVPVSDTTRGIAWAMLGTRTQDISASPPDLLLIAAVRGDRIHLIESHLDLWRENCPPCERLLQESGQLESSEVGVGEKAYLECMETQIRGDERFRSVVDAVARIVSALGQ